MSLSRRSKKITLSTVLFGMSACSGALSMNPLGRDSSEFAWRGPFYADLSMYNRVDSAGNATLVSCFEPTENRSASFLPEGGGSAYLDLEVSPLEDEVRFVGSFCQRDSSTVSTGTYRAFARSYSPVSLGGEGWEEGGTFLSPATSGKDVREIVLAPGPNKELSAMVVQDFTLDSFAISHFSPGLGWIQSVSDLETEVAATALSMGPLPAPTAADDAFFRYPSDRFWSGAWDWATGRFFSFYTNDSSAGDDSVIARSTDQLQSFTASGVVSSQSVLSSQMIWDGIGTTLLWTEAAATDTAGVLTSFYSRASWEGSSEFDLSSSYRRTISEVPGYLSSELILDEPEERFIPDFAVASDGAGTLVTVYYQWDPAYFGNCTSLAPYCQYRLVASVRTTSGEWIGPTPLDEHLQVNRASTTYYQEPETAGGIAQARPQVAYVGGGRFVVAAVYVDASDTAAPFTQIYTRGYTLGKGWDATDAVAEVGEPFAHKTNGTVFEAYRPINDLFLAVDPSGSGLMALVTQHLDEDSEHGVKSSRQYRHTVYRYDPTSGWQDPELVPADQGCPAFDSENLTYCNRAPFRASVFSTGETVVLVPLQVATSGTGIVLGSYEFRPKTEDEIETDSDSSDVESGESESP